MERRVVAPRWSSLCVCADNHRRADSPGAPVKAAAASTSLPHLPKPFPNHPVLLSCQPSLIRCRSDDYESTTPMTGGQPPRPPGGFCQYVIRYIYDSVRTCERENHFEAIDGTVQILGRSWRPLWEPEGPRLSLSGLRAYQWDYLYHRLGGTKWHNRPDFRGLPEAVSQPNQLQKEVAVSPDVSGGTMRTCAEIKGHDNCTFATP